MSPSIGDVEVLRVRRDRTVAVVWGGSEVWGPQGLGSEWVGVELAGAPHDLQATVHVRINCLKFGWERIPYKSIITYS